MDWYLMLLLHFAATCYMVGIVMAVQAFHYPALADAAEDHRVFEAHVRRARPAIAPAMLVEAGTGLLLLMSPFTSLFLKSSLCLLALIWISTFAIQVPLHRALCGECLNRAKTADWLVKSNWVRTVAWILRAFLLFALLRSGKRDAFAFLCESIILFNGAQV